MKAFPSRAPINADCIGIVENAGMDLLDYHAARALPLAYAFYKNGIESDGCVFEWDGEEVMHLSGSHVCYVSAPDEDEAIDIAHDELANMHQLDSLEVMDIESCEDSDDDEDDGF